MQIETTVKLGNAALSVACLAMIGTILWAKKKAEKIDSDIKAGNAKMAADAARYGYAFPYAPKQ